jgi:hypothetical protein
MRNMKYLNGVLTVIAALLALLVADRYAWAPAAAEAASEQPTRTTRRDDATGRTRADEPAGGLVSAGDQRKQMLAELRELGRRLAALESLIKGGLSVRVTEMPDIRLPKD